MVSHTFPGIAPLTLATETFDARLNRAIAGQAWKGSIPPLAPSVANNLVQIVLTNPNGSGVTVKVTKLSSNTETINRLNIGRPVTPVIAARVTAVTPRNRLGGGAAAAAVMTYDNSTAVSIANGDDNVQTGVNSLYETLLGIVLPAAYSVPIVYLDAATTDIVHTALEWEEY